MERGPGSLRRTLGIIAFAVALFVGLWHLDVVLGVLGKALGMLSFFVIGLCIAFLLNAPMRVIEARLFAPLDRRLGKRWQRVKRPLAVVLTVLFVIAIVLLVIFMVIPELVDTISVLVSAFPVFLEGANAWLASLGVVGEDILAFIEQQNIDWQAVGQSLLGMLRTGTTSLVTGTFSAASSLVSAIVSGAIGFIVALYVLFAKERLAGQARRVLYAALPERRADRLLEIGATANRVFSAFITGQFFESIILGTLCFLGMTIFRFPFAPMIGVLVGVTAFIPYFGAFIGCFIGAFMILVHQGVLRTLWFVLFFVILQQIEGDFIYPHVVGKSVMLPGLWVLTAVTLGGNLAGILGMLISVPASALLYALLREAVDRRNAGKGIPAEKLRAGG